MLLVATMRMLNRGTIKRRRRFCCVIQCSLPVYSNAKRSHATGTVTIPGYWIMTANIWVGRSALETWRAAPNDQTATASIRRANGFAQTKERLRHPVTARMRDMAPQERKAI